MRMSIVALAVLGASAASASAQDATASPPAPVTGAGAATIQETVCAEACLGELQLAARSGQVSDANANTIFTVETVDEAEQRRAQERREALTVGRQYTLEYMALSEVGDPFHGGLASQAEPHGPRADDSVAYKGRVGRIDTGAKWGKGDIDGSPSGRAWGMTAGFKAGPLTIRAAHQNRNVAKITRYDQVGITMAAKNSILAANMRFAWGTAYAAYSASKGWGSSPLFNPDNPYGAGIAVTPSTNSRDVLAGVAVPVTRSTTLLASFIRKNDRDLANRDARQLAVGATYAVSRRLDFYAAYSRIQHLNGVELGVKPGNGSAVNVGMRHAF